MDKLQIKAALLHLASAAKNLPQYLLLTTCFLLPWVMLSYHILAPLKLSINLWNYNQNPFIVLIFLCCLLATALSLCLFLENNEKFRLEFNYAAAISLAIVLWSAAMAPFAHVPWLSWTGAPQVGIGIVWYIILNIMIIGYSAILNSKYLHAFIINLGIAALVVAGLCFLGDPRHGLIPHFKWNLYFINEHIIFIGIPLIGLSFLLDNKNYRKILLTLGIIITAASTNRYGIAGVTVATLLAGTAYYYINKKGRALTNYSRYIFAAIIFAIPFGVCFIAGKISSDLFLSSVHIRYHFWRACIDTLIDNPARLLVGFGWGSYTDTILSSIQNIPPQEIVPALFYKSKMFLHPFIYKTWVEIGLNLNNLIGGSLGFHSHNHFIESLISTGVIGAFLFSALLISPVLFCEKSKFAPMVFCSTALSFTFSGWYEIPGTLPYIAVFLAIATPSIPLRKNYARHLLEFILPFAAIILLIFGLSFSYVNLQFNKVSAKFSNNQSKEAPSISVPNYIETSGPGGIYLSLFLRAFSAAIVSRPLTDADIEVLPRLLDATMHTPNPSLITFSSELPIYDFLMNKNRDPKLNSLRKLVIKNHWWENRCT